MRGLSGKVAVVAGGGGIGGAVARRLGDEGASVVIGDVDLDSATAVTEEIERSGGTAYAERLDVADPDVVAQFFERVATRLGGVDLLHANAADLSLSTYGEDVDLVAAPLDLFEHTMTVDLRGHLLCTRAAIPLMLRRGGGSIVYTSSLAAFIGNQRAFYSMAKAALGALARSVASGWGERNIRANLAAPGFVPTAAATALPATAAMVTAREQGLRVALPAGAGDVADVVAFLLSDESSMVQGQVLHVNGGTYMG